MSSKVRDELVGKRFLSVRSEGRLKVSKISEWEWRSGFIRAVSTRDSSNADFTALVEFDDTGWKSREYVKVCDLFQQFWVEHSLAWVDRNDPQYAPYDAHWPALCFKSLVDKADLSKSGKRPVEFLSDRFLSVVEEKEITLYKEGDEQSRPVSGQCPEVKQWVKTWSDYQDGQKILLTTPTVLLGYRVEVYRTEGTTQWYTAVIKAYNHTTKSLNLVDDTVLEEHNEDPTLIQMHLIGDGVVDSILNGVGVGVAQRRRPRSTVTKQSSRESLAVSGGSNRPCVNTSSSASSHTKNNNATSSSASSSSGTSSGSTSGTRSTVSRAASRPSATSVGSPAPAVSVSLATALTGHTLSPSVISSNSSTTNNSKSNPSPQAASLRGLRTPKSAPKRKQESSTSQTPPPSSPASKPSRKSPVSKRAKSLTAGANEVADSSGDSVCKQTCNVLVKRIEEKEEDSETRLVSQQKTKAKPPRLRDKSGQVKKPPDLPATPENENSLEDSKQECFVSASPSDANRKKPRNTQCDSKEEKDSDPLDDSVAKRQTRKAIVEETYKDFKTTNAKEDNSSDKRDASRTISVSDIVNKEISHTSDSKQSEITTQQNKPKQTIAESLPEHRPVSISSSFTVASKVSRTLSPAKSTGPVQIGVRESPSKPEDVLRTSVPGTSSFPLSKPTVVGVDKVGNVSPQTSEDMHYKKQLLRAGGNISPSNSGQAPSISEGIDVNRSLTEQLTKRSKALDQLSVNGDSGSSKPEGQLSSSDPFKSSSSVSYSYHAGDSRVEASPGIGVSKPHELISERHGSAFTSVGSRTATESRADSRASDGQLPGHLGTGDDKRPGSRLDDLRSVRSSPGSSPLIVDRHEAVHPYRDPELMRKNPVQSSVQNILAAQQQHKMSQPSFPSGAPPSQTAAAAAAAAVAYPGVPGVPPLPARGLLSSLPSTLAYTSTHQLPASISPHLSLSHGYPMEALVRAQQQQQHQLAAMHQQLLGYPANPAMATLEALWQRRFPSTPLPQAWPQKTQEALLTGELAALQREQLQQLHLEQERRERHEQERREKERKEILERERQEKEKAEREKAERERERLERERERLEKERMERERQEWELKQNQERILRESVDTVAAVDQHFAESLTRLATQQGITSMFGCARPSFIPKTEGGHPLPPPHSLASYHHEKAMFEQQRKEDKMKNEAESHLDEKRFMGKPGEKAIFPGYPYSSVAYPGAPPGASKPVFNLYGVPSAHSATISTEQLKQLIPDSRPSVKEEDKKPYLSYSPMSFAHGALSMGRQKEVPIKREALPPHNSVIVKREIKPPPMVPHGGLKLETPVTAHSHHSSSQSSSPRLQHPRPAHTPEHSRPLSSSPASSLPPHLLHHSTGPPPHSSSAFRSHHEASRHRSQSPYKPPATSQAPHPSIPQPLDYCKSPNPSGAGKPKAPHHEQFPSSTSPVSHPTTMSSGSLGYNYNLIQQGLVPNPIYSQGGTPQHPRQQQHNPPPPLAPGGPKAQQMSPQSGSIKRKQAATSNKDSSGNANSYSRKKLKGPSEGPPMASSQLNMSIPATTPEILSNPSPYTTTTSSNSVFSRPPGICSSYNDTFRSFVETKVEMAFQQDQERAERERTMHSSGTQDKKPELPFHPPQQTGSGDPMAASSSSVNTSGVDSSYSSRIMDTINRVATNQVDTDSDTLSASSPPPPPSKPSGTNSPLNRSGGPSHPHHMKKAWLQRHDEDKKSEMPAAAAVTSAPTPIQPDEHSNPCPVGPATPRDGISCVETPGSTGASVESRGNTPANVVVTLPNGNVSDLNHRNDESTSSASEAEMQFSKSIKKRVKSGKPRGSGQAKKAKSETEDSPAPPSTGQGNSTSSTPSNSSNSRKKINSSKKGKNEKDSKPKEDIKKDEASPKPVLMETSPSPSNQQGKVGPQLAALSAVNTPSPHSERSNPSPALSEGNQQNMSSSLSNSSSSSSSGKSQSNCNSNPNSKDKKKSRRNKDAPQKDGKKGSSFNKPLVKQTVAALKKNMDPFIQDGPCSEITPKLTKCRECKMTPVQRSKKQPNIFCRFYAFRRLRYSARGMVTIDGFSELSDADYDDIEPWLPRYPTEEPHLDVENSKFIIAKVGDKFCELVQQEREAKSWVGEEVNIAWKRAVTGVREMCDVCDTTLFNMHWVCQKCGFVVCLDCYKVRVKEGKKALLDDRWLTCSSNRQAHEASKMMLTQIIPSDALWELGRLIHDIRVKWSIPSNCLCGLNNGKLVPKNGINQQLLQAVNSGKLSNGLGGEDHSPKPAKSKKQQQAEGALKSLEDNNTSSLSLLAEVASLDSDSQRDKVRLDKSMVPGDEFLEEQDKKSGGCSTLRELLTKTAGKPKQVKVSGSDKKNKRVSQQGSNTLEHIIQSMVEKNCLDGGATPFKFLHYTPRLGGWKRELPIVMHSLTETSLLYPDIPHSWLCEGRLLRLHDSHHKGNLQVFQEQWKRGQPVLVSCANKQMNLNLWKPDVFTSEFGEIENEVVNCRTGDVIIGHNMRDFWDGFENLSKRPVDEADEPMLLKLKDWPPGDDFSEMLPSRFQDLMKALPLPEYTNRNGKLNLASRLPDFLVRPDLGPKMYNAYGSSSFPKEGTTNLHLDISDAVNVMVYVGIPADGPGGRKAQEEAAVKAIDDAGCDSITKRRVREVHEIPGALWHIYDAHDADKIRDFLNKVAKERGESIEKDHDAIHDQSWYLDKELCDRLLKEYGVEGYTIVQCLGDAIFIPAGAPHQVRNLHSCIKVAEDFVSPEHLNHCFRLTQEFRQLSETHSNHEDKLQVKNIVYHAVKDAIAVLKKNEPSD